MIKKIILIVAIVGSGLIFFTNKAKAAESYSYDNLASPDLQGKEYLGNGVYRLYDLNGITVDYNIYSGNFIINGLTSSSDYVKFTLQEETYLEDLTFSTYYKSGYVEPLSNQWVVYNSSSTTSFQTIETLNESITKAINDNIDGFGFYFNNGKLFENYTVKVQIEKGTTATPYQVPIQALEQHIQLEKDASYNDGLDDGWWMGYDDGLDDGYILGYNDGLDDGYISGYNAGAEFGKELILNGLTIGKLSPSETYGQYNISGAPSTLYYGDMLDITFNNLRFNNMGDLYDYILAYSNNYKNGILITNPYQGLQLIGALTNYLDTNPISIIEPTTYNFIPTNGYSDNISHILIKYNKQNSNFSVNYYGGTNLLKTYNIDPYNTNEYQDYTLGIIKIYDGDIENESYRNGMEVGRQIGYENGFNEGMKNYGIYHEGKWYNARSYANIKVAEVESGKFGFDNLLIAGFSAIGTVLSIELLPNISIGSIVAIPIVFGVIMFIIGRRKE